MKRRSQAVRLGAWLAALVGAVVLVYLALLLRVLQVPMQDAVAGLAAQLTLVKRALASVPPAQRAALARQLSDRKSTRLNSSHSQQSRMPSSA